MAVSEDDEEEGNSNYKIRESHTIADNNGVHLSLTETQ